MTNETESPKIPPFRRHVTYVFFAIQLFALYASMFGGAWSDTGDLWRYVPIAIMINLIVGGMICVAD